MNKKKIIKFSKNFSFGISTSAYQNEEDLHNSNWYEWEKLGRINRKQKAGNKCLGYKEWKKDIRILKNLGVGAYRFSIEWSRIEPEEGKFNKKAIEHYRNVLTALKKNKIEAFVTLFHLSLPIWFTNKGGFEKEENLSYFERFVEKVAKEYKNLVKFWITLSEPVTYSYVSYLIGWHPPGRKNFYLFFKIFRHLVVAHINCYNILKTISKNFQVGIVKQEAVFEPYHSSFLLKQTVNLIKYVFNSLFLESVFEGSLFFPLSLFKEIPKREIDFIGLDYYYRFRTKFSSNISFEKPFLNYVIPEEAEKSEQFGFEIYSEGIYQLLKALKKYSKPVYITENGVATPDDEKRVRFIKSHLIEVNKAMKEGADVRGFFYWTLFDNFEWTFGYDATFGLMTRRKKPKKSFYFYKNVCKTKTVETC